MTATYDTTTITGKIRLNTFGDDSNNPLFSDEELQAFYDQELHVKLAAARVLLVVASRELFIQKVMTNMGLTTDGAKLADSFRALAKTLKDEVKEEQASQDAANDETGWDSAQINVDTNTAIAIYLNARSRLL